MVYVQLERLKKDILELHRYADKLVKKGDKERADKITQKVDFLNSFLAEHTT
tara:strand:+ start:854 stop:1009 length:156 start_codon:yes stop_codon:yes gene_type:complete